MTTVEWLEASYSYSFNILMEEDNLRNSNNSINGIEIDKNCRHISGTDCRGSCLKLQGGNPPCLALSGGKGVGSLSWNVLTNVHIPGGFLGQNLSKNVTLW